MLAPSGGGLIFYQAYGNLYVMTGRKAHLLEDTQILTLGWHLEEIRVTWAHLEKKRTRLRTYTSSMKKYCLQNVKRRHKHKQCRRDLFNDGVWNLETVSRRSRLKEDLESSA
ncbi:hypothetical protein Tco_0214097 [Tanacetum coccineum]